MTQARSLSLVALVLAVALVVIHARVVIGGQTWDDVRYHTEIVPPRLAAAEALHAGTLPAWWDGTGFGVPLLAEPSDGALAPLGWLVDSTRGQDLVLLLYLAWAALGVALWARTRTPPASTVPSDHAALVVGLLVATSGVLASAGIRGALPGLAHLPWIGAAAARLAFAETRRDRARMAVAIGALLALVATSGVLAALVDGIAIVLASGSLKASARRYLAAAIVAALAIGCVLWIPAALQLAHSAGGTVHGLSLARLLELIVPASFGSSDPARGVTAIAGAHAQLPSLFVGAPLIALAAVRIPPMRTRVLVAVLVALALLVGRGGWPAWLGAPELHVAALVIVLGANAAAGLDALLAAQRRAVLAIAAAAGCTLVALVALAVLRSKLSDDAPAIDRALLDGGLGLLCTLGALVLAWRQVTRAVPLVLALLVLPSAGAIGTTAPSIDRTVVDREPAFAAASREARPPIRVFRPTFMDGAPFDLREAIATLGGASAWRWGVIAARSEHPSRLPAHDQAWLASAHEGGAFLDRYGIELAILPSTLVDSPRSQFREHARRGEWALVSLPVAPVASVMSSWLWSKDPAQALDLIFPLGGGTNPRGQVVLDGAGPASVGGAGPVPCSITAWRAGAIDLACTATTASYAVVTSSSAPGWSVSVDGIDTAWLTADVLRRAVPIASGTHRVAWRYSPPGLALGGLLAALGGLALLVLLVWSRREPPADDVN